MLTMEQFLKITARNLYDNYCSAVTGLSGITVVFPNRRARLFFDDYLAQCSDQPFWSPNYLTIEELFQSQTDIELADPIELVCKLHTTYKEVTNSSETLDSFWSWGEIMVADFDDIDKNLASTQQLFAVLKEQNIISKDLSFLSAEQQESLKYFFDEMGNKRETNLKEKFYGIWGSLEAIYTKFRASLQAENKAYSGMLQRSVIDNLEISQFKSDKYAIVGFNSLTKAEEELFKFLQANGKAVFYWDYDKSYVSNPAHEAGMFMRHNLKFFPNTLTDSNLFNNMDKPKEINIIEATTNNEQARYIPDWLKTLDNKTDKECAIVLCDETLLQPTLHSIPDSMVNAINVTMGYAMTETTLFNLISLLLDMQKAFLHNQEKCSIEECAQILSNPFVKQLSSETDKLIAGLTKLKQRVVSTDFLNTDTALSTIFRSTKSNSELTKYLLDILTLLSPVIANQDNKDLFKPLNQEALYRIYTTINRIHSLIEAGILDIQQETLCRLLRNIIGHITIPFHGEPVIGMQIMGLIETRNLDFKHILLISANEGNLPKTASESSFIPYSVRDAFGLTTMKLKSAVSSYNFYHLMQRAESITMLYNNCTSDSGTGNGEISRYLLQLLTERKDITVKSLNSNRENHQLHEYSVNKSKRILDILLHNRRGEEVLTLSPSAINQYIDCPLRFYFQRIAGLKEPEKPNGEIDSALFGTLFHKCAEDIYNYMASHNSENSITKETLKSLLENREEIEKYVTKAFNELIFDGNTVSPADYNGTQSINYSVICKYLENLLKFDMNHYAPFTYLGSESEGYIRIVKIPHPTEAGKELKVKLIGIIDRMDAKDGVIRIVDYKTGSRKNEPKEISELFTPGKNRNSQVLQIFYYAYTLCCKAEFADKKIAPVLLHTRHSSGADESSVYMNMNNESVTDFSNSHSESFGKELEALFSEIVNPDIPFSQCEEADTCKYCPFKSTICNR